MMSSHVSLAGALSKIGGMSDVDSAFSKMGISKDTVVHPPGLHDLSGFRQR